MFCDPVDNRFGIVLKLSISKPQHLVPKRGELLISFGILRPTILMNWAVKLHDKPRFVTVEIHDIVTNLMLPSKLCISELAITGQLPEDMFNGRLLLSQLTSTLDQPGKLISSSVIAPSPPGRGVG